MQPVAGYPGATTTTAETATDHAAAPPAAATTRPRLRRSPWTAIGLAILLVATLSLRLYGIDWDQRGLFHPDERAVLMITWDLRWPAPAEFRDLASPESPLNPGWFNYGTFPMYLLKVIQTAAGPFTDWDLFDLRIPGRILSAIGDTVTVLFVYLIAATWYGRRVGFLAAALSALAVIQIQLAHFFAFDSIMAMFVVAAVYFSVRVAREGRTRDSVLAGLMLGLGLATKFSVAPLALTVIVAHLVYALSKPGESLDFGEATLGTAARRQWEAYRGLLLAGIVAAAALFIAQPYTLFDFKTLAANVGEQSQMVRRIVDLPYTRQYIDTPKYLYQGSQLGTWGLGPILGIVTWAGFFVGLAVAAFTRRKVDAVILSWLVPYLLINGWFEVKFLRYMLPATPFLLIYAARLLAWTGDGLRAFAPRLRWIAWLPAGIVLVATAHYALAFVSMYDGLHPAKQVARWVNGDAHFGAVVAQEHWEEGIPELRSVRYVERLGIYDPDTVQKWERIADDLAQTDYLILYSNRLYATASRLPERYPMSTRFYEQLFNGSLGFELVFTGQKEREFLGIAYRDDPFARIRPEVEPPSAWRPPSGTLATLDMGWADESFTVYEHPVSFVFKNTGRLQPLDILLDVSRTPHSTTPAQQREIGLMMTPEQAQTQQAGGTWTSVFFLHNLPGPAAAAVWFLAAQVMALAAVPLSYVLFSSLPDRGYLLSKPLGLLGAATVAWLLASTGILHFSLVSVAAGILAVAALSAMAWKARHRQIRAFLGTHWRLVLVAEVLFLLAFLAFVAIRAANPDLWHPYRGGEKPMDFAYLNAVARSSIMPPYDPWFAGGYLNYYYFGQFIVATLMRLTGINPAIAYNLAVPILFALAAVACFSIVYNLAELAQRSRGFPPGSTKSPVVAGIVAAVLVLVAANIDGLIQVIQQGGPFDYWRSSRMMAPGSDGFEITEFPFFTFLFADLHAHLIVIPFSLLSVGLALSLYAGAGQGRGRFETWLTLAVLGATIGALRAINTWDFPTQVLIAAILVGGAELLVHRQEPIRALLQGGLKLLFVLAIGYLVFLPFHTHFELFNNGVEEGRWRTEPWRYLAIHSVPVFILLTWLAARWRGLGAASLRLWTQGSPGRPYVVAGAAIVLATLPIAFAATGWSTAALVITLAAATAAIGVLLVAGPIPLGRYSAPAAAMAVVGLLIAAGVDLFTVKGDIGRMNTVFKFYLQAWVLLGLAASYFLWELLLRDGAPMRRRSWVNAAWGLALAVLLVGVMIYPVLGARARMADRFNKDFAGLDGTAFMNTAVHWEKDTPFPLASDLEAIRWLQQNVEGSPVIVEGLSDLYRWAGRVSIYTGLPAVVGWDWHQRQQRVDYAFAVTDRRAEINRFYLSPSPQEALRTLNNYGVKYVYVGRLERIYYPEAGLAKFDQMADVGLHPVYTNGEVTIYEYAP